MILQQLPIPFISIVSLALYLYYDSTIDRASGNESRDAQIDALIDINRLEDPQNREVTEEHFIQVIQLFEGHLNILDEKIQSLSSYSLNFLALCFPVLYYTSFFKMTMPHHSLGALSLAFLASGLVASFFFINRIVWQDYSGKRRPVLTQLFHARLRRTRAFATARLLHVIAIALFADYLVYFVVYDGKFEPSFRGG